MAFPQRDILLWVKAMPFFDSLMVWKELPLEKRTYVLYNEREVKKE